MKKRNLIVNLVFAAVVLAVAGGLLALRALKPRAPALTAQLIYGDANETLTLPLDQNRTYDLDTGYLTVHIQVQDGAARFVDSPCPDHVCEGFGWISAEDQSATCLPARAVLIIAPAAE